jgi:hypothetical protein
VHHIVPLTVPPSTFVAEHGNGVKTLLDTGLATHFPAAEHIWLLEQSDVPLH